jgi:hypothetical protein
MSNLTTTELKELLIEADMGYSWSELEDWSWSDLYHECRKYYRESELDNE